MDPTKRKRMEESNSLKDNSEENLSKEIQATFEGRNLEQSDFHGIEQHLQQTFLKADLNFSELTDILINQYGIGSVLKRVSEDNNEPEMGDSNEVFGVTSVLNLSEHRDTPCTQQIFSFFKEQVENYGSEASQNKLNDVLNKNEKIGLLINERFLNIPAIISAPMWSSLQKEIKEMINSYNFQYYIMICKTYRPKNDKGETSFCNEEEYIFSSYADCSFEYSVENESDSTDDENCGYNEEEVIPLRKVLLFSANKFDDIISQVINFVAIAVRRLAKT